MRKIPLALLCLPLAFGCSSNEPRKLSDEENLMRYVEHALKYWHMRDLDRCEHQCLKGLGIEPEHERLMLVLGNVYLTKGSTEDILRAKHLFETNPNQEDFRIHLGLGTSSERLAILEEDAADAIASGERYTDHDPEVRAAELRFSAKQHLATAIEKYLSAEDIHDGELNAVNGLVRCYALNGDFEQSITWSRTLIAVLDNSNYLRRVELDDAGIQAHREKTLMESINRNTAMIVKTHFHVASMLRQMDRLEEAVDELGLVIALDPEHAVAFSRRADLFFQLGQYLKSREAVEQFIELEALRPFDDPEIRQAYELKKRCDNALSGRLSGR